jgi:hypothetical protein
MSPSPFWIPGGRRSIVAFGSGGGERMRKRVECHGDVVRFKRKPEERM